jgi:hypothetical protein
MTMIAIMIIMIIMIGLHKKLYFRIIILIVPGVYRQLETEKEYLRKMSKKTPFNIKENLFKITMKLPSIKIKKTNILTQ